MNWRLNRILVIGLGFLFICGGAYTQAEKEKQSSLVAALGPSFASQTAQLNGITLHYVRGGSGPAVILIHGFPQDWYEYHAIMPRLAKQFTVIAVDLPGVGGSSAVAGRYEAATMAEDVEKLIASLNLEHVYVVGHDVGGMVAYAYVRRYPQTLRGSMILDVPLPGIDGWDEIQGNPVMWHVRFMQVPGLAEKLVTGRQADYFAYFFQYGKITPQEAAHFDQAYDSPVQLHAVFEMYRAFPANAKFNAAQRTEIDVPVFLAAGDGSPFASMIPKMAEALRANGCRNVETGLIAGAVHYVVEDQPDEVAALIELHASAH